MCLVIVVAAMATWERNPPGDTDLWKKKNQSLQPLRAVKECGNVLPSV